jgi:hypothetical protein
MSFLPNVCLVAPPPLESDCVETEKLMGGCSPVFFAFIFSE